MKAKKQVLFRGKVIELDRGYFFADLTVQFKNLEIRMVVPVSMIDEWGIKVGDKVYVFIDGKDTYVFKR
ncbi:hypothetical protein Thal_0417 [Thermocrinis albus DSM 14484]|uniref:Uncharacterized protein n=1 Tax=Thermocrinis albus (strain DSM 14484 / JCM 11386 / HI 11/12) TaxID=638303 RepID=D3SPG5_THEAH|nr:hypothetical protein [Thermocrinis albus]ADC89052.1 hypothetical protein Thal_0417 [Thermocrinis albus DSM 14484]